MYKPKNAVFKPILALFFLTFIVTKFSFAAVDGEAIFKNNCSSCHKIDEKMTGPALKDIEKRRDRAWIHKWVHNSLAVIASGDDYAVKLYNEYNKTQMTQFTNLKDEEIDGILDYIKNWKPALPVAAAASAGGAKEEDGDAIYFVALLFVVFVVVYLLVGKVNRNLIALVNEKHPEVLPTPIPLYKNRRMLGFLGILAVIFIGWRAADNAVDMGRSQGYTPTQPIKYSHKLHAGAVEDGGMAIDCKYCHVGVEKGKQAGIPTVNICMNCHKAVGETVNGTGKEEIAKIRAAYESGKPVEWVRIHNLPDHVYFSHAQHVKAGKLECQTCHGEIQKMEVVSQHAPLSMGWCINCHRETKVMFNDNKYYAMYEKLHQDMKDGKIKGVTEAMMGGLECQKCHY
jgi:mono/diheme cytochrome c family protein